MRRSSIILVRMRQRGKACILWIWYSTYWRGGEEFGLY